MDEERLRQIIREEINLDSETRSASPCAIPKRWLDALEFASLASERLRLTGGGKTLLDPDEFRARIDLLIHLLG
ncbi:MAG: hypothetical protein BroJett011_04520 [Chloroflexota bacterium]|nr:MAG: hypothetical protein BroJett011_04520 [Chloroflexota bacterium]